MRPTKEVYFNVGEQEWINALMETFGATKIDACNSVIRYKREQAFMYRQQGNDLLADQLLDEIGELDAHRDEHAPASKKHYKKIFIPGQKIEPVEEKKIIIK